MPRYAGSRPRLHPHPLAFEVHSGHVEGVIRALHAALVTLAGDGTRDDSRTRLMRGLVPIITAEGPRLILRGSPPEVIEMEGLDLAVEERLRPLLVEALRDHPLLPRLIALARTREADTEV